jgi:hypothetical protein
MKKRIKKNNIPIKEKDQEQKPKQKQNQHQQSYLVPLKPVKKEEGIEYPEQVKEQEKNNIITVATPANTRNTTREPVVEEYQYENVNLADPSALTIHINDPTIPGIGDLGDQSLSSIDGEEGGIDTFLDDIAF